MRDHSTFIGDAPALQVVGVHSQSRHRALASFFSPEANAAAAGEEAEMSEEEAIELRNRALHAQELAKQGHRMALGAGVVCGVTMIINGLGVYWSVLAVKRNKDGAEEELTQVPLEWRAAGARLAEAEM